MSFVEAPLLVRPRRTGFWAHAHALCMPPLRRCGAAGHLSCILRWKPSLGTFALMSFSRAVSRSQFLPRSLNGRPCATATMGRSSYILLKYPPLTNTHLSLPCTRTLSLALSLSFSLSHILLLMFSSPFSLDRPPPPPQARLHCGGCFIESTDWDLFPFVASC